VLADDAFRLNLGIQGWNDARKVFGILRRIVEPAEGCSDAYRVGWDASMELCAKQAARRVSDAQ
jgi:hypothetical protein